jgi:hypothetical protein
MPADASVDPTEARNEIFSRYATPSTSGRPVQPIVRKPSRHPSVLEFSEARSWLGSS